MENVPHVYYIHHILYKYILKHYLIFKDYESVTNQYPLYMFYEYRVKIFWVIYFIFFLRLPMYNAIIHNIGTLSIYIVLA